MAGTNSVRSSIARLILHGVTPGRIGLVQAPNSAELLSYLGNPGANYALDLATNLSPPIRWLVFTNRTHAAQSFFRIHSIDGPRTINRPFKTILGNPCPLVAGPG